MNLNKCVIVLIVVCLSTLSCSDDDSDSDSDLTGIWKSDFNNILYSIDDLGDVIVFNPCNEENPYTLIKNGDFLFNGETGIYNLVDASTLTINSGPLEGTELRKLSDNMEFNSGSLSIESLSIEDVNATMGVCAYREDDGVYNIVAAPYLNGYLSILLFVQDPNATDLSDFSRLSLAFELPGLSPSGIVAVTGTINITEYTSSRLAATFQFIDSSDNTYTGFIDVNLL